MSDARTIRVDPKDMRIDGLLMRRIGRLLKPYWINRAHWKSWMLVLFGILMGPVWAYYNYTIAQMGAAQANTLVARNGAAWYSVFWLLFFMGVGQWVYQQILNVLNMLMNQQWYQWMTRWVIHRYLGNKTYYDIAMKDDIDNPDERIQANVDGLVGGIIGLPSQLLGTILGIATNGLLLNQVTTQMTVFVVTYSLLSLVLQTVLYWPLIKKNFHNVAANADFRYGLLRIRDNAETIAFFRGEAMEETQVQDRLNRVIKMRMSLYYYGVFTNSVNQMVGYIWALAPLVFIYPLYFSGKIEFGMIALATAAAAGMMGSITSIQQYVPMVTGIAPGVVRLSQVLERFDELDAAARGEQQIKIERGRKIALHDVSFQTPGGEQQLAQNVSLAVEPGESVIIIGQTGVGKSSILRSMAGLWTRGSGAMTMPDREDTMFVPQKPYMMLGNLRAQLLYPYGRSTMTQPELQAVLERVCLPDLIEKNGGLEADNDWAKVLSLGEQQRVSFARILISKPRFVFLDEATSAVDATTEATLYETLIEEGITFVSVGHRETILRFHDRALRLYPGGTWDTIATSQIKLTPVEALGASRDRSDKIGGFNDLSAPV